MKKTALTKILSTSLLVLLLFGQNIEQTWATNYYTKGVNRQYPTDLSPYGDCRKYRETLRDLYQKNLNIFYANIDQERLQVRKDLITKINQSKAIDLNKVESLKRENAGYASRKTESRISIPSLDQAIKQYQTDSDVILATYQANIEKNYADYIQTITSLTSNNDQNALEYNIHLIEGQHRGEATVLLNALSYGCNRNSLNRTKDLKAASTFIKNTKIIDEKYSRKIDSEAFKGKFKLDVKNADITLTEAVRNSNSIAVDGIKNRRATFESSVQNIRSLETESVISFCDINWSNINASTTSKTNNNVNLTNTWFTSQVNGLNSDKQNTELKYNSQIIKTRTSIDGAITNARIKYSGNKKLEPALSTYRSQATSSLDQFIAGFQASKNNYEAGKTSTTNDTRNRLDQSIANYQNSINIAKSTAATSCSRNNNGTRVNYDAKNQFMNSVADANNIFNQDIFYIKADYSSSITENRQAWNTSLVDNKNNLNENLNEAKTTFGLNLK